MTPSVAIEKFLSFWHKSASGGPGASLVASARWGIWPALASRRRWMKKTVDETAIVVTMLEKPPERLGVTHWSSRLLAAGLGISSASIIETWRKWDLHP